MFYIGLYRQKHEKVYSENCMARALIFGMLHDLNDLYQDCSNWPHPRCHQGHGQLSTDFYMQALNKTQVSHLGPLGPLVVLKFSRSPYFGNRIYPKDRLFALKFF